MIRKILVICCITLVIYEQVIGLPVVTKDHGREIDEDDDFDDDVHKLSYKKYLKEVMSLLMTDEEFKRKIMVEGKGLADKAKEFSTNLDFVSHDIRSRLDELKRKELDRLRNLTKLRTILKKSIKNLTNEGYDMDSFERERLIGHVDQLNTNSFEPADLERLIIQTSSDLKELDVKRREAFRIYEIEKELERRRMLGEMDGTKRDEEEKKMKLMEDQHKDHPKVHHPGNEAQLLDVWELMDGMDREDFDRKTFFYLHDINGDGFWDHNEVEALFQRELDKVYERDAPEDDMVERFEEMNRMREHLVLEVDKNRDTLIALEEFLAYSSKKEFKTDEEWEAINGKEAFDESDLQMYKVKLEKLKLESVEGKEEELIVEKRILGNISQNLQQQSQSQAQQQANQQAQQPGNQEHQLTPDGIQQDPEKAPQHMQPPGDNLPVISQQEQHQPPQAGTGQQNVIEFDGNKQNGHIET